MWLSGGGGYEEVREGAVGFHYTIDVFQCAARERSIMGQTGL